MIGSETQEANARSAHTSVAKGKLIDQESSRMKPNLYIVAGPNGAGKTTFATDFLPNYAHCAHFINADMIAQGVAPFSPESAAIRAGRIMLDEIKRLAKQRVDFGIETTLSGKIHLRLIRQLQATGYAAHLFFLWIPNEELAISRIRTRVARGGHNIPASVVHRRFSRSLVNFFQCYCDVVDSWTFIDNAAETPRVIASRRNQSLRIIDETSFRNLQLRYA